MDNATNSVIRNEQLDGTIRPGQTQSRLKAMIQPIDEEKMCFGVITDASYANTETYSCSSQGGFGVLCYDKTLEETGKAKGNLLRWKSGKIANSTLKPKPKVWQKDYSLQELAWSITIYNELDHL